MTMVAQTEECVQIKQLHNCQFAYNLFLEVGTVITNQVLHAKFCN